jgi:hypothetical protein
MAWVALRVSLLDPIWLAMPHQGPVLIDISPTEFVEQLGAMERLEEVEVMMQRSEDSRYENELRKMNAGYLSIQRFEVDC